MRIIYHHRTQLDDAQGIHVRAMVRAFRALGHEVEVISLLGSADGHPPAKRWRVHTSRLPRTAYEGLSLLYNVLGYYRLARALRGRAADLIYERYALNTVCGVLASRRSGVPLLLEVNAPWPDQLPSLAPLRFRRLARRLERWICSNGTRTIAVSEALRQLLIQEGAPEHRLTVMHNAVDPAVFNAAVSGQEVRRRYGLEDSLVAGFVGWLRHWHGLADLIDAVRSSELLARGLRLLIVGIGPAFQQVERRVRELGLEDRIILTGAVVHEDVPAHVAALDIALQPRATAYACPMKLIEYMAMGRCIVAPDQPNIRELLSDRMNARLFPPGDYRSLIQVVSELMDAPAERVSLGRNALHTVVERDLTWHGNVARALALLRGERHDGAESLQNPPVPKQMVEFNNKPQRTASGDQGGSTDAAVPMNLLSPRDRPK
jgi:glycosyltransferase involved in cell wall biosynthesis